MNRHLSTALRFISYFDYATIRLFDYMTIRLF
jgi:hypothetical protein